MFLLNEIVDILGKLPISPEELDTEEVLADGIFHPNVGGEQSRDVHLAKGKKLMTDGNQQIGEFVYCEKCASAYLSKGEEIRSSFSAGYRGYTFKGTFQHLSDIEIGAFFTYINHKSTLSFARFFLPLRGTV